MPPPIAPAASSLPPCTQRHPATNTHTSCPQFAPPVEARALLAGDPVKNPNAILRYALPINNKPIREIQVRRRCLGPAVQQLAVLCNATAVSVTDDDRGASTFHSPISLTKPRPHLHPQVQLESISKALRIPGSKSLGPVAKAIRNCQNILKKQRKQIEQDFVPAKAVSG